MVEKGERKGQRKRNKEKTRLLRTGHGSRKVKESVGEWGGEG